MTALEKAQRQIAWNQMEFSIEHMERVLALSRPPRKLELNIMSVGTNTHVLSYRDSRNIHRPPPLLGWYRTREHAELALAKLRLFLLAYSAE